MRSERQIQASRSNGARSRGAVTPEGKLASSQNAITHGMLAGTVVLKCESEARFLELLATLHHEFQPQTPFEESLIENMAAARWRQLRVWGMEKAIMDHEMDRQAEMSPSNEHPATRAALAFRALGDDSRSLELINRYDSRYERQYLRAHRRFLEVRDRRTPPAEQPPPPGSNGPQLVPKTEPPPTPAQPNPGMPETQQQKLPNEPNNRLKTRQRSCKADRPAFKRIRYSRRRHATHARNMIASTTCPLPALRRGASEASQ